VGREELQFVGWRGKGKVKSKERKDGYPSICVRMAVYDWILIIIQSRK